MSNIVKGGLILRGGEASTFAATARECGCTVNSVGPTETTFHGNTAPRRRLARKVYNKGRSGAMLSREEEGVR